jgi:histidinol-phosphatase (PHP family)
MSKGLLDYTYHSHTERCGHAYGTDEEFIQAAIERGLKIYGVSDHIFLPGVSDPGMRGEYEELDGYCKSIRSLAEKYKDKIKVHLAFEAEWYGDTFKEYYEQLKAERVDYLILGQHNFLLNNRCFGYGYLPNKRESVIRYVNDLTDGMRSGLFAYVAHPDLFLLWYRKWDDLAIWAAEEIAKTSAETGVPLEVNMGQSHWAKYKDNHDYTYPSHPFWDIVSKYGCKAIIGMDAHTIDQILTSQDKWYLGFVKKHKLNYINRLPFDEE